MTVEIIKFNYAHLLTILLITVPTIFFNTDAMLFIVCLALPYFWHMSFMLSNVVMRLEGWFHVDNLITKEHVAIEQMRQLQVGASVNAYEKYYSLLRNLT